MPENDPCSLQPVDDSGHSVLATQTGYGFFECGKHIWHATHGEIHREFPPQQTMHSLARQVRCGEILEVRSQGCIRHCEQELLDFANQIRYLAQMIPEKISGRTDRERWHLLREVFQRSQSTGAFLDFIKKRRSAAASIGLPCTRARSCKIRDLSSNIFPCELSQFTFERSPTS